MAKREETKRHLRQFLRGDTLIEVMFAVGIFGLVSVSAITLMNRGLYSAQGALEITMARNEIDTQAEALRFLHDAYVLYSDFSEEASLDSSGYTEVWNEIIDNTYTVEELASENSDFFTGFNGNEHSCADLYENMPRKSFIINPRLLGNDDVKNLVESSQLSKLIIRRNLIDDDDINIRPASIYPRLVYGIDPDNEGTLSDAGSNGLYYNKNFYSAEGIYVTAVASEDGIDCSSEGGDFLPDFYDFYIRTCWDSPDGNTNTTIGTTIRLYNSDQVKLTAWQIYNSDEAIGWEYDNSTVSDGIASACKKKESLWKAYYNITFHANGGNGLMSNAQFYVNETHSLPSNQFTRKGYAFSHWNLAADDSRESFANQASITNLAEAGRTVNLYAQWYEAYYDIVFDSNGGNGSMNRQTIRRDEGFSLPANTFTRSDYHFVGWSTNRTGTGRIYSDRENVNNLGEPDETVTLYAKWEKDTYNVVFRPNGGKPEANRVQTINRGDQTALNTNPFTRTNYTFAGWNTKADGTGTSYRNQEQVLNLAARDRSITLYAQWTRNTFKVHFDANGGTGTMFDQSVETEVNTHLNSNTFTRENYNFSGWNTAANGSGTSYSNGATIKDLAGTGQTITLYAQWTRQTYNVIFHPNGGSPNSTSVQTINRGMQTNLTTNGFSRTNYTFRNWNTRADGTGTSYANQEAVTDLVGSDRSINLYAQWTRNTFKVHFDANGGNGSMSDQTINTATDVKLTTNSFTRSNYAFSGWNTAANGSGTSYTNGATIKDLTETGQTITLYAQWTRQTYKVIFEANGGSGSMSDQTINRGQATALTANAFSRANYNFAGWNTRADGSGTSYSNGQSVTDIASAGGSITLYAKWTRQTYKVIFNANGGNGSMNVQEINRGEWTKLTKNTFTRLARPYYVFSGWSLRPDGYDRRIFDEEPVIDLAETDRTIVLYAQWTEAYLVVFDGNGGSDSGKTQKPQAIGRNSWTVLNENTFSRTNYNFTGWNTKADGSGTAYSNSQVINNLANFGETITLYAQWAWQTYNIRFDANGGIGTMENQTVPRNRSVRLMSNGFTRQYYDFIGWNTKADGSGENYFDKHYINNLANSGETITLYAQWIYTGWAQTQPSQKYTVIFDGNGLGYVAETDQIISADTYAYLNAYAYNYDGRCDFKGWNTKSDGSGTSYPFYQRIINIAPAGGFITLYAQWNCW